MSYHRGKVIYTKMSDVRVADVIEKSHRKYAVEGVATAISTTYKELALSVFPERKSGGTLYVITSSYPLIIGCARVVELAMEWLKQLPDALDILSVSSDISADGASVALTIFLRTYEEKPPSLNPFFDTVQSEEAVAAKNADKVFEFSKGDSDSGTENYYAQRRQFLETPNDVPFLNTLQEYKPIEDPVKNVVYNLSRQWLTEKTRTKREEFIAVYNQCVSYLTTVEYDAYVEVMGGRLSKDVFMDTAMHYIQRTFIETERLQPEDVYLLKQKLDVALFGLYIIQDLISNCPEVTDIKVTAPDSVRFRVYGKAYLSDINFLSKEDYFRFVQGLAVRNRIDLSLPTQTFTDERDEDFILRFTITAGYLTNTGYPAIHVRKVSRKKLMSEDLIAAGMFDEKVRNYLLDCGKKSKGVVFAGPPGSGKTICLNWFLEDAYEDSAEILVIQENDELFSNRKGIVFEHVITNPREGEKFCDLEALGKMALVAGANVFVIGEAKGAEICSAITLANSGCRTSMTIHSQSAEDTIEKMADLAMRGYADSYVTAKRMLKSFQTLVYLRDFKVVEIKEIIGYDEENNKMIFKNVYSHEKDF